MRAVNIYWHELAKAGNGGEGSRGGHIIAHTSSGKPVYGTHEHMHPARDEKATHFEGFTSSDHHDAANAHSKEAHKHLAGNTNSNHRVFSHNMALAQAHIEAAHGHHRMAFNK